MRRVSVKRQQLNREVSPYRQALRMTGKCEGCGAERDGLEVHEICRGSGLRPKALDKPFATLLQCRDCHYLLTERLIASDAIALALAWLKRARPRDFNLESFYRLTNRRWPEAELIEKWCMRLAPMFRCPAEH